MFTGNLCVADMEINFKEIASLLVDGLTCSCSSYHSISIKLRLSQNQLHVPFSTFNICFILLIYNDLPVFAKFA